METRLICRFCLTARLKFKFIENADHKTLDILLPTLNLQLSKDPVVCTYCSDIMQKYFAFKTVSLDVRGLKDVCLFCKNSTKLFTFANVFSTGQVMGRYFPEFFQGNMDLLSICPNCYRIVQKIIAFLVNWQNVEQRILKYSEALGVLGKGEIDLECLIGNKELATVNKNCNDSNMVKLAQQPEENIDKYAGEENKFSDIPTIFEPIEILNTNDSIDPKHEGENDGFVDINVKVEVENENIISSSKPTGMSNENDSFLDQKVKLEQVVGDENINTDTDMGNLKIEQVWLEEDNIDIKSVNDDTDSIHENVDAIDGAKNYDYHLSSDDETKFPFTGDHIRDSIERVVRRWANYQPVKDKNKPIEDEKKEVEMPRSNKKKNETVRLKDNVKAKMLHKQRCWINTTAINSNDRPMPQYFSKPQLRSMISRIEVSGEKKYQCQVCNFIARAKCSMNRHMILHQHPSELQTFYCHSCSFTTKRKGDLVPHMRSHLLPSQRAIYQCQQCPFSAKMKATLGRHLLKHEAEMAA